MRNRGWLFTLVALLTIPFASASLFGKIGEIWDSVLYVGGLGFLNLPGSSDLILFLRLAIGILVFTILFALGVLAGSETAQFLNRKHAAIIAGVITVMTMVFIPSTVLVAISASFGTLVSLLLLAAPLVLMVMLVVYLPNEPCVWDAAKTGIAALILWILNLQQVHLTKLTSASNYIPVNEAVDWAAFIALLFFFYYLIRWILCALGGDDNDGPDFGDESPLRKLFDKLKGKKDDDGNGRSGNDHPGIDNSGVPNPGTGAAGDLGQETRSMFELILKKINELSIDMNEKFKGLEAWLQSIDENVKLNSKQILKFESSLESIKNDLLKEIKDVVHKEVNVLHKEIKEIATQMGIIHKETLKFVSRKHKEHIKEIERTRKDLIQRQEKLIKHQEKIIEKIKEITSIIEKLERESVRTETVKELIKKVKEIREKIVIIEAAKVGIDKLDIDAIIQLLRNLELKVNIEINNNNTNTNTNTNNGGGSSKPRGSAALEFYVNNHRTKRPKVTTDLRDASKFTEITLKNSGTGGNITYFVTYHPALQVNIQNNKGILKVGQSELFSVTRRDPLPKKIGKRKYASITIRAKEGRHHQDHKNWHWFNKNKRWHYEVSVQIQ
ncbi:hypothetical protein CL619_04785 [archaeon]|nr:hypothetical protein [archaeon]|tara:strand:+ start:2270 stop:4105 length:1836 start_codon:yes stop_codon:yes gene_type:complete